MGRTEWVQSHTTEGPGRSKTAGAFGCSGTALGSKAVELNGMSIIRRRGRWEFWTPSGIRRT